MIPAILIATAVGWLHSIADINDGWRNAMKLRNGWLSLVVAIWMLTGTVWAGDAVDINTATAKQLQSVDGIGAKTAAKIVAYREAHGAFKTVDELSNIKGIGKKRLKKAGDELTVGDSGDDEGADRH